jgi:hypothetical protein
MTKILNKQISLLFSNNPLYMIFWPRSGASRTPAGPPATASRATGATSFISTDTFEM